MTVDTLSRRALLEMKQGSDFAPRVKVWPPEGYVAPTSEEFAALRQAARRYSRATFRDATWKHVDDDQVLRRSVEQSGGLRLVLRAVLERRRRAGGRGRGGGRR
jgi:hypothetical protein